MHAIDYFTQRREDIISQGLRKDHFQADQVLFVDNKRIKYILLTDKARHHPPVFDGTDKTVPTDLQDKSVVDEIEEVNEGEVRCKLCDSNPAHKSTRLTEVLS